MFCAPRRDDPAVPLVQRLMADHPWRRRPAADRRRAGQRQSQTQQCASRAGARPPIDWSSLSDSNVLMPRDYLQRLLARWRRDTGLVCFAADRLRPDGFWAEIECAFLNTYQARWQYFADSLGVRLRPGQDACCGASADLEAAGGIRALGPNRRGRGRTKIVRARAAGAADGSARSPAARTARRCATSGSGRRRWARLRRASFPRFFLPEIFSGSLFPLLAARGCVFSRWNGRSPAASLAPCWRSGMAPNGCSPGEPAGRSRCSIASCMLRDLMLPVAVGQRLARPRLRMARSTDARRRRPGRRRAPWRMIAKMPIRT